MEMGVCSKVVRVLEVIESLTVSTPETGFE